MSNVVIPFLSPPDLERLIVDGVKQFLVVRYIIVAVYTVLLLEHLSYLPEEIEHVWKSSWNFAKVFFLIYRYSTIAGLTMVMHVVSGLSGSIDETLCQHVVGALVAMMTFSMAVADGVVMLRVSVLWGRQRAVLAFLLLSFVVSCAITFVCASFTARSLVASTIVFSFPNVCVPLAKPTVVYGVWIPGMVFDVLVLTLTSWNVFSRPRGQTTALTQAMYRDGIAFFLILAALRFANFVIAILSRLFIVGVCVAWPISVMTLSRFVFHLRSIEESQPPSDTSPAPSILEQEPNDDVQPAHLPRGSLLRMQHRGGVDMQSHDSGSTAIGSYSQTSGVK